MFSHAIRNLKSNSILFAEWKDLDKIFLWQKDKDVIVKYGESKEKILKISKSLLQKQALEIEK